MNGTGPSSHRFVSQRMRLHYVDWGNTGAPPLLMIHGSRDHCRSWDWAAEILRKDWHVIALDLRGHGDSDWVNNGQYLITDMIYDVHQLVDQLNIEPVTIVAHSLGGAVSSRFAGAFPDKVRKLVNIEGLGPSPQMVEEMAAIPYPERLREWVANKRAAAARIPRRYASICDALQRMKEENTYLTEEQARHLTLHGVNRNEDGSFSWKFDPHLNVWPPVEQFGPHVEEVWQAITCPVLLLYGSTSFASNPEVDGRIRHFSTARVVEFDGAGHWLHHDRFERFMDEVQAFL